MGPFCYLSEVHVFNAFKGPFSKPQFGVRKGLLMEKLLAEKMRDLILKFILIKYRKLRLLLCQGKGKWKGLFL